MSTSYNDTFKRELLALLHRFGAPESIASFTIRCDGPSAPVMVDCTFSPEFEKDRGAEQAPASSDGPVEDLPIGRLGIGPRALNALKNENLWTLGDLTRATSRQLLRSPNFGRKSLNEVVAALRAFGLELAANPEPRSLEAPAPPVEPEQNDAASGPIAFEELSYSLRERLAQWAIDSFEVLSRFSPSVLTARGVEPMEMRELSRALRTNGLDFRSWPAARAN